MSLMRAADYLNAGTNEVEACVDTFKELFPAIERLSHFLLSTLVIIVRFPIAAPLIFVLMPISFFIQRLRAPHMRGLLERKQLHERQFVSHLADVIENTNTFRSLPGAALRARCSFGVDTAAYAKITLEAVTYNVVTKETVEMVQGIILVGCLLISPFLVNSTNKIYANATPGNAVFVIGSFLSGSKDLIELANALLKMKFNSEGVRNVARVLNIPTDAHSSAAVFPQHQESTDRHMGLTGDAAAAAAAAAAAKRSRAQPVDASLRPPMLQVAPVRPGENRVGALPSGVGQTARLPPLDHAMASFDWVDKVQLTNAKWVDTISRSLLDADTEELVDQAHSITFDAHFRSRFTPRAVVLLLTSSRFPVSVAREGMRSGCDERALLVCARCLLSSRMCLSHVQLRRHALAQGGGRERMRHHAQAPLR